MAPATQRLVLILKFIGKRGSASRVSKTPANKILAILIALALTVPCLNASREVPIVHRVEPIAKAAFWHGKINKVREISFDILRALSAFVARHSNSHLAN